MKQAKRQSEPGVPELGSVRQIESRARFGNDALEPLDRAGGSTNASESSVNLRSWRGRLLLYYQYQNYCANALGSTILDWA